jgi:ABC-type multidrug transport system ATPase subunit/pSer/pThr/pTyr-binding forkhead associated (FHA) protein
MTTPRRWVIGRAPDCDLVVSALEASARHCQLTETEQGFVLEDLGSSNGTFVNGERIDRPVPVKLSDQITLGQAIPLPWPRDIEAGTIPSTVVAPTPFGAGTKPTIFNIGRAADNDIVLDYPMVSAHHARIIFSGEEIRIEDLGSRNGTFLGVRDHKITQANLTPADAVYFGSLRIPAARLLGGKGVGGSVSLVEFRGGAMIFGRHPSCDRVLDYPMVSGRHARLRRRGRDLILDDLGSTNGTFVNGRRLREAEGITVRPGDVIGLGSYLFTLLDSGDLQQRDYRGDATLEARAVSVKAAGRPLIEDVSLTIYPSEFVGLMGPSGAGKTTLMNALNGYTPPSSGAVLLNGQDLYEHYDQFRTCLGYVPQDDVMHRDLTVGQALFYSARLRLPADYSTADVYDRINTVLRQLGLEGTEDVLIGSAEKKGISGGQRRRVNLAMELLTDPLVLFLDEPTSGLSSEDALTVMKVLRNLADAGKTILLTIHQPSLEVFRLLDNLVLMARDRGSPEPGRLVYFGPAYPEAVCFFNPDLPQRPGVEPSPDEVLRGLGQRPTAEWCERYQRSEYARDFLHERTGRFPGQDRPNQSSTALGTTRQLSVWHQWWVLVRRMVAIKSKDRINTAILLVQAPIVAILLVLVFGKQTREAVTDPGSLGTTLFLMALAALWFGASNAVRDIVGEWAIYRRERMVNLKIPAYLGSKLTVLGGLCLVQCATLLVVVGIGCDLKGSWAMLFALLVLASLVGTILGLMLSALARTSEVAIALLPIVLLPMVILGGAIQPMPRMHQGTRLLCEIIPTRWAFEGLLQVEARQRPQLILGEGGAHEVRDMAEPYFPQKDRLLSHEEWLGLGVLAAMLASGVVGVAAVLRWRDVH